MRRLTLLIALVATACGMLLAPAGATAAKKKKAKNPTVTSVSPMRIKPGANLVIRGRNFSRSRRRNTVILAVGRRSIFAKPSRVSSRRLVVKLPASVERLMSRKDGGLIPTRFSIKVAAGRKFSRKTARRLSPVIVPVSSAKITPPAPSGGGGSTGGGSTGGGGTVTPPPPPPPPPADCDRDGTPNSSDSSSDIDLLSDSLERSLKTDPCDADTDNDGAEDGFEYRSALDLNHYPRTPPLPFPGRRPYPNALDPTDGKVDYDGDSLTVREEYLLWVRYAGDGTRGSHPAGDITNPSLGVLYSDGLQKSLDPMPLAPSDVLSRWAQDLDGDGRLRDDERDGDGDGLSNYDESHGRFTEAWWVAEYSGSPNSPKESKYPDVDFLDNEDTALGDALADPDLDGDDVMDGYDDHDHDGVMNKFEVRRGADAQWGYVQPFNPCKPFNSERCHRHPPFGHYQDDENPPIGPALPATGHPHPQPRGGPGTPPPALTPATPNG